MAAQSNSSRSAYTSSTPSWLYYYQNLHLLHFTILVTFLGVLGLSVLRVHLSLKTALLACVLHLMGFLGITAGYHRLWTHKSYEASLPLRVYLAIVGGGAQLQWSIVEWVTHHRAHHWYTDTDKDPQDATKGFFFRHMGWLLAYKPQTWGSVNISDLMEDPVVRWQQKNYLIIFVLGGLGLPTFIAHFGWNDWQGGLVYAGFLRVFFSLQVVFFSGALMHADWAGEKTYSDKNSSVNMSFISILNNGEGNHNFHHTFPSDYRNGVQWYDIDLSKWMILLWCQLGLARNPVTVTEFEIERAHRRQERRNRHGGTVEYVDEDHEDLSALPVMQWTEYIEQANTGRCLVCINGVIHDISDFMGEHPGGRGLLHQVLADDGTSVFYNGSHDHSSHAKNVLAGMRIAVLEGSPPTNPRG